MCDTPILLFILGVLDVFFLLVLIVNAVSWASERGELNPEGMAYKHKEEYKRNVLYSSLILVVINLVYWMIWAS